MKKLPYQFLSETKYNKEETLISVPLRRCKYRNSVFVKSSKSDVAFFIALWIKNFDILAMDQVSSILNLPNDVLMDIFDYVPNKKLLSLTCKHFYKIICKLEANRLPIAISDDKVRIFWTRIITTKKSQWILFSLFLTETVRSNARSLWNRFEHSMRLKSKCGPASTRKSSASRKFFPGISPAFASSLLCAAKSVKENYSKCWPHFRTLKKSRSM